MPVSIESVSARADGGATAEGLNAAPNDVADANGLWASARVHLRRELRDGNYTAWFGDTRAVGVEGRTLVLEAPNHFAKKWIEGHYLDQVRGALRQSGAAGLDVAFCAADAASETMDAPAFIVDEDEVFEELDEPGPPAPEPRTAAGAPRFHPKYSFDSFVIGASNRFAHAAALAVAEAPAQTYNPLFIYGGAGLGKTHLLHAIGHYVEQCHPGSIVRYVSSEEFTNDFIQSVQRRTIPDFHSRYRAADLLLVDDIQFLEGKERTQEEFFHTFNALHPKSQLIITSDRPPKKLPALEERLRTRFEWGLITDVQPPDLETRLAILNKKAEADSMHLPPEVMELIAGKIQTNIRELEGALIRVAAYASLTKSTITIELANDVLQSLLPNAAEARVTSDLVILVAAKYFGVTPEEIRSSSRTHDLVVARQTAMYLCRELTDLSLPKIGQRFGGRDHSTVIYATNKVRRQMQESQSAYEQVQELTTRIRQQAARG